MTIRPKPRPEPNVSPSSRRAWVEILAAWAASAQDGSPSSRRAWVEIRLPGFQRPAFLVSASRNSVLAKLSLPVRKSFHGVAVYF